MTEGEAPNDRGRRGMTGKEAVILRSGVSSLCHSEGRFSPLCHSEELRSEESLGRCFWDGREDSSLRSE